MTAKQRRIKERNNELDLTIQLIRFVQVSKLVGVRGEFPNATVCDVKNPGVDPWFRIYISIENSLGYLILFQEGKTIWRETDSHPKSSRFHKVKVTTPLYHQLVKATEEYLQKA